MLTIKNLNKYYHKGFAKKLHVINDTSIEIPETGIIAVVGESGAGKTTLLNAISGLDSYKSGEIAFDELVMKEYNSKIADKLRMEHFGFIFQNYYLLKDQTVYDNINLSLEPFDLTEEEKKARIIYVLKQLDIERYVNKLVGSLSGGEQQRVSIARALVKSPKVIFADEPTGSLDEKTTFTVLNILKKLSKSCAVFIVTHEKELISYYADYIIEISEGVVIKEFAPVKKDKKQLAVDRNIYLDELNKVSNYSDEKVSLNFYKDESEMSKLNIDVAIKEDKIYLDANQKIIYLDDQEEIKLIKGERILIEDYVSNEFDYELPPVECKAKTIKYLDVLKKGYRNYTAKRPFKLLLKIVLIALAVISVLLVESIKTINNKDLSKDLNNSKGNIYTTLRINDSRYSSMMINNIRQDLIDKLDNLNYGGTVLFDNVEELNYEYKGFYQLKEKKYSFKTYDFKTTNLLDQKTIIIGRAPKARNEIVVDEYVFKRFMSNNYLAEVVFDYSTFVGDYFVGESSKEKYKVVGITRTKSPTIYGNIFLNFLASPLYTRYNAIDYDSFILEYPEYKNLKLGEKEYLVRENDNSIITGFAEKGKINEDNPYSIVVRKEDITELKKLIGLYNETIYIATDGSKEMIDKYESYLKGYQDNFRYEDSSKYSIIVDVENRYQIQYDKQIERIKNLSNIFKIVALVMVILAVILIVFTTNQSMVSQIGNIAIYRSLGYPKLYLSLIYLVELVLNTIICIFIGTALTYVVLSFISVVPLISYSAAISFSNVLLIFAILLIGTNIIGFIPVFLLMRHTPTQIYNIYNRKIEQ